MKRRDFLDRATLFEKASEDEKSFFDGRVVRLPNTPFMDMLLEDGKTALSDFLAYYWWNHCEQRAARLRRSLAIGDSTEGLKHLDQLLATLEVTVVGKEQRLLLGRTIVEAEIDALDDIRKVDESRHRVLMDRLAAEPQTAAQITPQHADPLLSAAAADWIAEKSVSTWSARRKDACKATLALFLEVVGDKSISGYSKADARDFKSVLADLPPNRSKLKETRGLDI